MDQNLDARIEQAKRKVAELRRRRGEARLDEARFDEGALAAAERELAALADARSVQKARSRNADRVNSKRRRNALGAVLTRQEDVRLKAIRRAEAGARDLVAGLNEALQAAADMRETIKQMATPVPLPLAEGAFVDRLSQRLAAVLGALDRHPARFGQVAWRASWRAADDDWAVVERDELTDDLSPLTQTTESRSE